MARTHDIRPKISDESHAYLIWRSRTTGQDMLEIAADILHDFALEKLREIRLANEILEEKGLAAVVRPRQGIA